MKDIWISQNELLKVVIESQRNNNHISEINARDHYNEHQHFLHLIAKQDTINPLEHGYVSSNLYDQIKSERDIAMSQLESYGVGLGEKAELERVVYGEWITKYHDFGMPDPYGVCSVCGFAQSISDKLPRCPNCGMKIMK